MLKIIDKNVISRKNHDANRGKYDNEEITRFVHILPRKT